MAVSYVSARFEKSDGRLIIRNRDDGGVPPLPGPLYYPTSPDTLRNFLVIEYVNDTIGERLVRIATLSDLTTYNVSELNQFEIPSTAGVVPGSTLRITLTDPTEWLSEEYPATPFDFTIVSVVSATRLEVAPVLPAFKTNVQWSITSTGLSGSTGITRRSLPDAVFLDSRMNLPFGSTAELEVFVEAAKASLDALAAASTASELASETYTSKAT